MNRVKKYEIFLFAIALLMHSAHKFYDLSGIRADIYLLYDYPNDGRLLANICYEIGRHLMAWTFMFILWRRVRLGLFFVFFVWVSYDFLTYLLFFGQGTNLVGTVLFIVLFLIYGQKRKV